MNVTVRVDADLARRLTRAGERIAARVAARRPARIVARRTGAGASDSAGTTMPAPPPPAVDPPGA